MIYQGPSRKPEWLDEIDALEHLWLVDDKAWQKARTYETLARVKGKDVAMREMGHGNA